MLSHSGKLVVVLACDGEADKEKDMCQKVHADERYTHRVNFLYKANRYA
jgi:hypothetical protein